MKPDGSERDIGGSIGMARAGVESNHEQGSISLSAISRASSTCSGSNARGAPEGRYAVVKLVAQYGPVGSMVQWREQLSADCPKHGSARLHDR